MKIQMIYNNTGNNMSFILCLWISLEAIASILSVSLLPVAAAMNAPVGVQQLQKQRQQQQQQDKEQKGETCGDATSTNNDECKKADADTSSTTEYDDDNTSSCRFYLSESQVYKGSLGLFATTHFETGEIVNDDFWVPIRNYNPIEYSMWHDIAISRNDIHQRLRLELDDADAATLELTSFVAGIGSTSRCHDQLANIHPVVQQQDDDQKKQTHDMMMYISYIATSPIRPGQELFTTCNDDLVPEIGKLVHPIMKPLSALTWYGTCMDRLFVKHNSRNDDNNDDIITKNPNPTAHSKRHVSKGQVVASSPIVLIDRSQMEIVQQSYDTRINKVVYTEHVQGYQELLNYCYGHVNSSVLLLPYGPNVYAISHSIQNDDTEQQQLQQPNVKLAWKNSSMHMSHIDYLDMDPLDAMDQDDGNRLIIDYIAIRDISPGEQLVLDGGLEWQNAWKRYQDSNTGGSSNNDHHRHYRRNHYHHPKNEPIRTVLEQSSSPYPKWIQTACWYRETMSKGNENNNNDNNKLIWNAEINNDCLRPCHIVERQQIHQNDENKNGDYGDNNVYVYTVRITDIPNPLVPAKCKLSDITKGRFVHEFPSEAITFVNKPRSKLNEEEDPKNPVFFRHELAVPDQNFYPTSWYTYNRTEAHMGDFLLPELQVGQIERIRWADTKEVVTRHAYVIGIPSSVRRELMKFCDYMGITERFKDLTYRGNSLKPGEEKEIILRENSDWLIQRPMSWKSNLHWISPANKASHREYLQALSAGGYDSVLRRVGNYFGFDGLACYHIAFIAVSHSTGGLMHFDVDQTGGKAFAMIVPLILVNGTDPELALKAEEDYQEDEDEGEGDIDDDDDEEDEGHDDEENWGQLPRTGGLKYRYEVAAMMGDRAHHSTSSVDYRVSKEMRMAATIYVADINKDNLEAILAETQNYPPRDRPDLLWSMAGRDWKRDDPSVKLPEPTSSNTAAAATTCEAEAE